MSKWILAVAVVVGALGAVLTGVACSNTSSTSDTPSHRVSSLTIYPITAAGRQHQNVAEALGLLLEKEGFGNIEIARDTFRPTSDGDFETTASSFGEFVGRNPITTEYALYCEFAGTAESGVEAVREVLVDRAGKVIWSDVQTPSDRTFKKVKPDGLMGCCLLVSNRLEPMLVKSSSSEPGKMEKLWADRSGTPDRAELDRMKARAAQFDSKSTVTVYPVRIGDRVDRSAATDLVRRLNDQGVCVATAAQEAIEFDVASNSNEQRVLWDMAKSFREKVRSKKVKSDYTLYADYILVPNTAQVWAVHFALCDADGNLVIVDFQNNHHDDFNTIDPESIKDCNRLAARRLKRYVN